MNDFFFNRERRQQMEDSLVERLNAGGGPFVVIAHSQGSMIAYNVLRQLSNEQCDVRLFVTIGSPLGMQEVQDVFRHWYGNVPLQVPPCVDRWLNVADRFDPVAADQTLGDEYQPRDRITDVNGWGLNPDGIRHAHSATGYLRTSPVQDAVRATVENAFAQAVGRTIIAKDLVNDIENGFAAERHQALIQLASRDRSDGADQFTLETMRQRLSDVIKEMVDGSRTPEQIIKNISWEAITEIELLQRFVAAQLTRLEIERLRTQFKELQIERVWRNASKKALINRSTNTVQARPANLGYGANGVGITWAVLDTGIRADHPHFQKYRTIKEQWDCTKRGQPTRQEDTQSHKLDKHGHGTHVAGVIAGYCGHVRLDDESEAEFAGMAPQAKLVGFKVLDNEGNGRDAWIIKALDKIAEMNESAGRLVIHGVNLSLGGNFDPSVYGVGHTPLCQELRRLWNQGVLVVLAAGNEGYALLQAAERDIPVNLDLSIGDPANLEEAIAVGSIHKSNPHTYGVSYFSSRGPTADGRLKPDLVAPGEQILSAYHNFVPVADGETPAVSDLYIEMSGTSMAAPHVSGILAAFLSMRREFIGYPDRVKQLLLDNCTDLGRDRYMQGRGMPNLIRMLANS